MNNNNKNTRIGNWSGKINAWCNKLSHKQRLRFILIISTIYFLMAIATFLWIYYDAKNGKEMQIKHIQNPIPAIKKAFDFDNANPSDSLNLPPQKK